MSIKKSFITVGPDIAFDFCVTLTGNMTLESIWEKRYDQKMVMA